MSAIEINTAGTDGDQREKMLSPSEENTPQDSNGTSALLNFCTLTPCQFGISVQSFTPATSANCKDKSRLAQIKARRRSSIGVRGSPETNSLICFMAKQRMKTPTTQNTPEHVRNSPFLPRVPSTLRQKMASFQSLIDVEESEVCDLMPEQDDNTGECIKTRDYPSDGSSKENHPPLKMPTPKKRKCLAPLESCEVQIREASTPVLHFKFKEQEEAEVPVTQVFTQGPLPPKETLNEAQAVLISPPLHVESDLQSSSPSTNQQDGVFELQSPNRPLADVPASPPHIPCLPSLLEMNPTEDDFSGKSTINRKKRVRFGGPLSPELFDKNLPPSTPLQKGGTPARAPTPGGGLQLRSLLKTPQRSEAQMLQAQPDYSNHTELGASPTLALPRNFRMQSVGKEREEADEKYVFPSIEEVDSALSSNEEYTWNSQPLNLNTAFNEESLSQMTESECEPITESQINVLDESASLPEKEKQPEATVEAPVRPRTRRKKPEPECESTSEAPARSSSRKREHTQESELVKRSTRSAAKMACKKMKKTATATRQWKKDVDRSLYGSREYASKNPNLSPIKEWLSFISQSPPTQATPFISCPEHTAAETHLNPENINHMEVTGDIHETHASQNASEDLVPSPSSNTKHSTGKGRRLSGPRSRGRRMRKSKVSVADCDWLSGGNAPELCEEQTATNLEASRENPLYHTAVEQTGVDVELNDKTCADTLSTHSTGNSGTPTNLDAFPISGEELNCSNHQQNVKQLRINSANSPVLEERSDQVKDRLSHEVEEKVQGDHRAKQHDSNSRSSSDCQEEEQESDDNLAPWQAEFNFEDVFKPVSTRGQRSVRRSLRNQSSIVSNNSNAGLAWLPRTSPESTKEARRRTRDRRLRAVLPVQPSASEETHNSS